MVGGLVVDLCWNGARFGALSSKVQPEIGDRRKGHPSPMVADLLEELSLFCRSISLARTTITIVTNSDDQIITGSRFTTGRLACAHTQNLHLFFL